MEFNCTYSELVSPNELKPHPRNPNLHPKSQIERLAKILNYQGQRSPIVVSKKTGYVIVGHGRLEAIKSLGWHKCAVDYQDFEDDAQEYSHMVADNALSEYSKLDIKKIKVDIKPIEVNVEMLGIKDLKKVEFNVLREEEKEKKPKKAEEKIVRIVSKPDQVWLLDSHKIIVGQRDLIKCDTLIKEWQKASKMDAILESNGMTFNEALEND